MLKYFNYIENQTNYYIPLLDLSDSRNLIASYPGISCDEDFPNNEAKIGDISIKNTRAETTLTDYDLISISFKCNVSHYDTFTKNDIDNRIALQNAVDLNPTFAVNYIGVWENNDTLKIQFLNGNNEVVSPFKSGELLHITIVNITEKYYKEYENEVFCQGYIIPKEGYKEIRILNENQYYIDFILQNITNTYSIYIYIISLFYYYY